MPYIVPFAEYVPVNVGHIFCLYYGYYYVKNFFDNGVLATVQEELVDGNLLANIFWQSVIPIILIIIRL